MMKLTFLGATETVTGSKFLLESRGYRVLVDCGLFQGVKQLRERNWQPLPVDPSSIDAVVLTHAHIDHSGYLPVLFRDGFTGPVYCTPATESLCGVLLPDAAYLQEEESRYLNKRGRSRHSPALPLFNIDDAERALAHLHPVPYHEAVTLGGGIEVRFSPAGHIIGSACVHITDGQRSVVFTGDVGRPDGPVMNPPEPLGPADYLVMETTYGNRTHPVVDPEQALAEVINRTFERGGAVLIPAFAVGRTQTVLYLINRLMARGRIPEAPVFLNSPMAIKATRIFCRHLDEHRLDAQACDDLEAGVTCVQTVEDSKALTQRKGPMIIVSASGMATGGRVLHHLKAMLPDEANTVLFVGFQAAGTRGESLVSGADEIKIHGEYIKVHAEIARIDGLSVHADRHEMLSWLASVEPKPRRVFLVHGEPSAQDAMRRQLKDFKGWSAEIPTYGESVDLS